MDMLTALNGKDLMRQAAATAQHYMICAVKDNDEQFGSGYAAEHP
jgi:hypothetical protein